jgi:glycosyltransferase involved in cell wall biosynthesis
MNILILTGLFPPESGGPATYVPRIATALKNQNHSVEIITAGTEEANQEFDFSIHRVPKPARRRLFRSVPVIRDRLSWADQVYVNGLELDYALASVDTSTPSVQKIVGDRSWEKYQNRGSTRLSIDEFQTEFPGLRSYLERTLHRFISRQNDEFIVPSNYLKSIVSQWGINSNRINVIHNHSLPPETIPETPIQWPGDGLKLLSVGRMVPWKRFPELFESIEPLTESSLIVLGDGPTRSDCERKLTSLEMSDRVILKGVVPRPVVWNHLRQADVFVLNSTYEGFPHVVLEALENGTPVVAADSGGTSELAEYFPDQITLYDKNKPSLITKKLRKKENRQSFDPPERPDPLKWETIVNQTSKVLASASSKT